MEDKAMRQRRDNKGRILRRGEQQRKDGSYMYTVLDPVTKKRKFIYSWKLERHDKMPAGKKLKQIYGDKIDIENDFLPKHTGYLFEITEV